ncbi:MAG: hypothetical protein CSA62_05795 [Planctomycetota bacterium]|nr:MAG: hypothetical protein CSA62_05795 [Planctomycetota bacterium]
MIFRLVLLLLVSFLGALAYCARMEREPHRLARIALQKTAIIALWVIGPFVVMLLIERMWIDP